MAASGRALLVWGGLLAAMAAPILLAATSPYLAYRSAPYIIGGFAGIFCLSLFVIQPLLAAGYLSGAGRASGRAWHRWIGAGIVIAVALHVIGLYVASPQDTLDALLLVSPTPFSVYGVLAMAGVAATAALVAMRRRMRLRPATWIVAHNLLALIVVVATVIHALQIEGAMEVASKWLICLAALAATGATLAHLRVVKPLARRRQAISSPHAASNRS